MTRWKASGIHLAISALIGLIAFCLLYFVYYPHPFFKAAGASQLVLILLSVDVVLGPLLTLAVFKSGKWGMKFDLGVIALLQIAALVYGLYVMWVARPVYFLFAVDRVDIIYANQVRTESFTKAFPPYNKMPIFGPKWAAMRANRSVDEKRRAMDLTMQGYDSIHFPEFYGPPSPENLEAVWKRSLMPSQLTPSSQRIVNAHFGRTINDSEFKILPIKGHSSEFSALFDGKSDRFIDVVEASAWTR
jgi:hypothetical protein